MAGVSKAALIHCSDGEDYVVKGAQVGRALVAEHIVAILGRKIGAPIPEIALIDVPASLVGNPLSQTGTSTMPVMHFQPGVGHGSRFEVQTLLAYEVDFVADGDNAHRFAVLALLYGWVEADDHQFLYRTASPRLVFSHDHGHFLPGGPEWTPQSLAAAPAAEPVPLIVTEAGCSQTQLHIAAADLRLITDDDIADAVAAPETGWGLTMDERIALAQYLRRRRLELLASIGPPAT